MMIFYIDDGLRKTNIQRGPSLRKKEEPVRPTRQSQNLRFMVNISCRGAVGVPYKVPNPLVKKFAMFT